MILTKHIDYFNPAKLKKEEINIIGCGAIGSNIALQLTKLGVEKLIIWDFDKVDEHNITNQVYEFEDIGLDKTEALSKHLKRQNPQIEIQIRKKYTEQALKGIIFVCVDSVELRNKIAIINRYNIAIKLLIDGRIGLETGQVYCIDWYKQDNIETYIKFTEFKDNEVTIPVSACGTTLSVSPSVLITVSYMISCLINYVNKVKNPTIINLDAFNFKTITR